MRARTHRSSDAIDCGEGETAGIRFDDRVHAGELLAHCVRAAIPDRAGLVVYALPRGGVPVARVVADELGVPLTATFVRKIGAPGQEEYGIGAVTEDGVAMVDHEAADAIGATGATLDAVIDRAQRQLVAQRDHFSAVRTTLAPADCAVALVVDDGLATGVSAIAAARYLRRQGAPRVDLAVPVCARESLQRVEKEFDCVVYVTCPTAMGGVSRWYEHFDQTSDELVARLLAR